MGAITLTYDQLVDLKPCSDRLAVAKKKIGGSRKWNGRKVDAQMAREAGMSLDDVIWVASSLSINDKDVERRLFLWLADCLAHIAGEVSDENVQGILLKCVAAQRRAVRNPADADARKAWDEAAWAAWDARAARAAWDAWAARDAWDARAAWAAWDAWDARDAEEDWQFDRLCQWLSADEPEDWPLPAEKSK